MNEKISGIFQNLKTLWNKRNRKQQIVLVSSVLALALFIGIGSYFVTKKNYVPLYKDLSVEETGQIKAELETRKIPYQLGSDGTSISVPDTNVDALRVDLAAEGIPNSGKLDFGSFGDSTFGMSENEFDMSKLKATQNELSTLIKGIEGINNAKVMVTLPKESVFVSETNNKSTASILLDTTPGFKPNQEQINGLYHLVSKSIPNLSTDNIVIRNQNLEYYDYIDKKNLGAGAGTTFEEQQSIRRSVEQDLQRRVEQMLGMLMGADKVLVNVTADIDFKQENREEQLVTPVDKETGEGIAISAERIKDSYTGTKTEGGTAGTGDNEVPNYATGSQGENGSSEHSEERINYEVNRINKTIVESPYKVRDLGIQVIVEPPEASDINSLTPEMKEDIQNILSSIISTTVAKDEVTGEEITPDQLQQKVSVSVGQFNGKQPIEQPTFMSTIPMWVYIAAGAVLFILIGIIVFLVLSKRKNNTSDSVIEDMDVDSLVRGTGEVPDLPIGNMDDASVKRKQLEKLAKENPTEFAKLLRTWLAED
ncbi:MAG: flagellar basal-body MS-ring/collar protein FliF [Bacilli bacterium]